MVKQNGHWYIGTFHESEYPAGRPAAANGVASEPAK
jgi:hypothetical protein